MGEALQGVVVIFDLDGTLIDTAADLAAAMNHVLVENGREPIPVADVRHLVGHGAKAMIRRGFGLSEAEGIDEALMDRFVAQFLDYYLANIAVHSRPFPGVLKAIASLASEGARFVICTNKREAPANQLIDTLGLKPFFDVIAGSDTTYAAKPDPAMVRYCLERMDAKKAIFIGDSDTDIKTAHACGMPCLFHAHGYGPSTLVDDSLTVFHHYDEFSSLVKKLAF